MRSPVTALMGLWRVKWMTFSNIMDLSTGKEKGKKKFAMCRFCTQIPQRNLIRRGLFPVPSTLTVTVFVYFYKIYCNCFKGAPIPTTIG
jgi:hypothetical protein